jgi:hypothetical protein
VAVDRHSFKKDATSGSWVATVPKEVVLIEFMAYYLNQSNE